MDKKCFYFSVQLAICVNQIIKYDFPGRWTQIVDKISIFLQNPGELLFIFCKFLYTASSLDPFLNNLEMLES